MAQAFTEPKDIMDIIKFNCDSKKCDNYKTYDNCRQCSRNIELVGRHAFRDRFKD